jgi:hypothetical protein
MRPFKDTIFESYFSNPYYKSKDTYKDTNGKGILERFVDAMGQYLDTFSGYDTQIYRGNGITKDIDNFLDCIDIGTMDNPGKSDNVFLNFLWDYFGRIPYGYAVIYYGAHFTKKEINQYIQDSLNLRKIPGTLYRDLIKYCIPLYKIRGTNRFYKVLGRLYDVDIDIKIENLPEPVSQTMLVANNWEIQHDVLDITYDKLSQVSGDPLYDYAQLCNNCTEVTLTVSMEPNNYNKMLSFEGGGAEGLSNMRKTWGTLIEHFYPVNVKLYGDGDDEIPFDIGVIVEQKTP